MSTNSVFASRIGMVVAVLVAVAAGRSAQAGTLVGPLGSIGSPGNFAVPATTLNEEGTGGIEIASAANGGGDELIIEYTIASASLPGDGWVTLWGVADGSGPTVFPGGTDPAALIRAQTAAANHQLFTNDGSGTVVAAAAGGTTSSAVRVTIDGVGDGTFDAGASVTVQIDEGSATFVTPNVTLSNTWDLSGGTELDLQLSSGNTAGANHSVTGFTVSQTSSAVTFDSGVTNFDPSVVSGGDFTHAINIGGPDVTVNGVVFDQYGDGTGGFVVLPGSATDDQSGNGYEITSSDGFLFDLGPSGDISGDGSGFVTGFQGTGGSDPAGTTTLRLDDLVSGEEYELLLYFVESPGGSRVADFIEDGVGIQGTFDTEDGGTDRTGSILTYNYTATGTSMSFTIDGVPNSLPHFHAFSNRLTSSAPAPEPSTAMLVLLGGACMLLGRRKRSTR